MWLVGSKPIRSNVTIPTTSFSHIFFFSQMTSCAICYDIIYHLFPINSQYLKTWQADSPEITQRSCSQTSLHCRSNLTPISNICEAVPKSLFRAPNRLNELPQMSFEFPFILIGKSTMAFLIRQSRHVLKSWYTGGAQNNSMVSQTDLTRV